MRRKFAKEITLCIPSETNIDSSRINSLGVFLLMSCETEDYPSYVTYSHVYLAYMRVTYIRAEVYSCTLRNQCIAFYFTSLGKGHLQILVYDMQWCISRGKALTRNLVQFSRKFYCFQLKFPEILLSSQKSRTLFRRVITFWCIFFFVRYRNLGLP